MVSQFATGYATDAEGRPFPRRRTGPAIAIATVLTVAAIAAWSYALVAGGDKSVPIDCNPPTTAGAHFSVADRDAMLDVAPAAQSTFRVSVLNSAAARGEARSVSEDLIAQGFAAGEPAYGDDTVYPDRDLHCAAQIRFGQAGQGAAAAVWLALPCAQLIDDGRTGSAVDVALGEFYTGTRPSQDMQAALESLRSVDPRNPKTGVDRSLIESVHSQSC